MNISVNRARTVLEDFSRLTVWTKPASVQPLKQKEAGPTLWWSDVVRRLPASMPNPAPCRIFDPAPGIQFLLLRSNALHLRIEI